MKSPTVPYYFGRLNLIAPRPDKKNFILDSLRIPTELPVKSHRFGFFDIEELKVNNHEFVFGKLVKFRPELSTEVADRKTHTLEEKILLDSIVAKAPFVLHFRTGIIAFRTSYGHITIANFRKYFAALILLANDHFFVDAEVLPVAEELEIQSAIRSLRAILVVDVTLHPTNPSNRHLYKRTDDRIKELEAGTLKEKLIAKDEDKGLRVLEDSETMGKIAMAEDGYGSARIVGVRQSDGQRITISTKDEPVTANIEREAESPLDIASQLMGTFQRLFERKE
jgi:hypothetical protein